jgi:hypothetical protein
MRPNSPRAAHAVMLLPISGWLFAKRFGFGSVFGCMWDRPSDRPRPIPRVAGPATVGKSSDLVVRGDSRFRVAEPSPVQLGYSMEGPAIRA